MKVKFRMDAGQAIRDGSGTYACPNLYCWREYSTSIKIDTPTCPKCGIELDWNWVKER